MFDDSRAFVTRAFLRAALDLEFRAWTDEGGDATLFERLKNWDARDRRKETSAEAAFMQTFFVDTWGYRDAGRAAPEDVTLYPKLRVAGAGAGGGVGEADAAMGLFGPGRPPTPQVVCEFKDIRSALDAPQARKGNTRSPVRQCLDYLRGARKGLHGNEPVLPWWGLVTDMNEFRLYWWDRMPEQYVKFSLRGGADLFQDWDLLSDHPEARFDRFLFHWMFHRDRLLSPAGRPSLLRLVEKQWARERNLEGEFYGHYRGVRERLFAVLTASNPDFPGTPSELLRLTQKLLDRFIFAFYCEDMGGRMAFPPQMIRDRIKSRSLELDYDPLGDEFWSYFKRFFGALNTGGRLGQINVPHINGGLFAPDPQIEALSIPNHVFAATRQGENDASLEQDRTTLLYLCARYNYAASGSARESLSLYTLGRIFEQSITELEYRQGELENRDTVVKLSERKRNGVYYTPEWAVNLLVRWTVEPWFERARAVAGWPAPDDPAPPTLAALEAYEARLKAIRIVDPACGSGAFLISAFRRLLDERLALARRLATTRAPPGTLAEAPNEPAIIAEILAGNLYGVDLNPSSVEIAKLALWLHSARADAPLSQLDRTLRCGNSLVGADFWQGRADAPGLRERVRAFDWNEAFPEIGLDRGGGFDIVLGNPPYVKRQHIEAAAPETAAYLAAPRGADTYRSARTKNFDLYLPFIEKGLRLLGPGGRLGYIAPSLWPINEYGEGLRGIVREGRFLERWADFKSFQVFPDVTVYTALQVFAREPTPAPLIAQAPGGEADAAAIAWDDPELPGDWEGFAPDAEWLMTRGRERALIQRLARDCRRLDDPSLTAGITVGIQTSADDLYHLRRVGRNRYLCTPKNRKAALSHEVEIEDAIMRPLVSGPEAKRYQDPVTDTWLLFPYARDDKDRMRLIDAETMAASYPKAWAHFRRWEAELRGREKGAFDDDAWWRFGRNQNIDKQDTVKLVVAQTVPSMRVCIDATADKYLNNVRVNGILPAAGVDPYFLLGALNGSVADFVFRRVGKPKDGGWFEANKQFIAPLPIPNATSDEQGEIAERARRLQHGHTRRRDLTDEARKRLNVLARPDRSERWLWPDLPDPTALAEAAPRSLKVRAERRAWADARFEEALGECVQALQARLDAADPLDAVFANGELRLVADGATALGGIFLNDVEGRLAEAHWRFTLMEGRTRDAEALSKALRRPPAEAASPAATQFIERVDALRQEVAALELAEYEM